MSNSDLRMRGLDAAQVPHVRIHTYALVWATHVLNMSTYRQVRACVPQRRSTCIPSHPSTHRHALVHSYVHSCSWPGRHTSCAHGHVCAQPPACTPVYSYTSARPCSSALSQRTPARHLQTNAVPRHSQPEEGQTEGSLIGQTWQLSLFHYSLAA